MGFSSPLRLEHQQVRDRGLPVFPLEIAVLLAVNPEGVRPAGSSLTGRTPVFRSSRNFGFSVVSGNVSLLAMAQDQLPSSINWLNVTRISVVPGSTWPSPASGTVLTTTGGAHSSVISWP